MRLSSLARHLALVIVLGLGAGIARKGWLTKADVINALPVKSLRKALATKRKTA